MNRLALYQHEGTGLTLWSYSQPGPRWYPVKAMYEVELPDGMNDDDYATWYQQSAVVDGVRMGPSL